MREKASNGLLEIFAQGYETGDLIDYGPSVAAELLELREKEAETDQLRRFVGECLPDDFADWGDLDGFELERICLECGILERMERTEFCGEGCACSGYYGDDDFPIQCNRLTELGKRCVADKEGR